MKCPSCNKDINLISNFLGHRKEKFACPYCGQAMKLGRTNLFVYAPIPIVWLVFVFLDIAGHSLGIDGKSWWSGASITAGLLIGGGIYFFCWKKILRLEKSEATHD